MIAGAADARPARREYKTLKGDDLTVTGDDPDYVVGTQKATIVCGNVPTANATVYIIDTVLMPPTM